MLNIQRLEQELDQEGHMADNLVSAMKPKLRDRYVELKNQNTDYQIALEKMNQELDTLNSRKIMLEDEVAISALKREALTLYENLRDLELKRDELVDESSNRGTPAEERERLLAQVSDDFCHFTNKTKNRKFGPKNRYSRCVRKILAEFRKKIKSHLVSKFLNEKCFQNVQIQRCAN